MHLSRIQILQDRASMLAKARSFFDQRHVIEVDCPALSRFASVDAHIDLIPTVVMGTQSAFLHSSPEYGMKRLLSEGIGDVYQLSHVFRDGEYGPKHNPEFMMAEWYRCGMSFEPFIAETLDFMRLFLGPLTASTISYKAAFESIAGINPYTASDAELHELVPGVPADTRDDLLNYILALHIEPHLGIEGLTVLAYYPPEQAALAKICMHEGVTVAERFEVYYRGIELANGYHELQNSQEQLRRLEAANQSRIELGKTALPIDKYFIESLEKGLPNCCGVAVGFDRLLLLRHQKSTLADVITFDWQSA